MSVRAKFVCTSKVIQKSGQPEVNPEEAVVTFAAVCTKFDPNGNNASPENQIFGKWTPNVSPISMTIRNPSAYDQFEQGKEYYVDFTPAD